MKALRYKYLIRAVLFLVLLSPVIISCEDDGNGAAPLIERVSIIPRDSTIESGYRDNSYVIFGKNFKGLKEVYFNEAKASFNPTYVRNDNIIIKIPANTPYRGDISNRIRVVTENGSAEFNFVVKQAPQVTSFFPAVAGPGELVTVVGSYFESVDSVKFIDIKDTNLEYNAEIVKASPTEDTVWVKVPEGSKVSYISVGNYQGVGRSEKTFGFNKILYTDVLADGWNDMSWDNKADFANTQLPKSGNVAGKFTYAGAWNGFSLGTDAANGIDLAQYSSVKISVAAGAGGDGKKIKVVLNEYYDNGVVYTLGKDKEYIDITVNIADFKIKDAVILNRITIQDQGAAPYVIYVDDVGLL